MSGQGHSPINYASIRCDFFLLLLLAAGLAAGLGIGKLPGSLGWPLMTKLIGLFFVSSAGVVLLQT